MLFVVNACMIQGWTCLTLGGSLISLCPHGMAWVAP